MPVYAFAQNSDICGGAMSKAQAAKLKKLYGLALKTGAPVVGFYDSVGGRLNQGTELLAGCGDVLNAAASLSVLYRRSRLFSALASEQTLLTPQAQTSLS